MLLFQIGCFIPSAPAWADVTADEGLRADGSRCCVCTLLSICVSVYLGVAWKACSLLALCCFFSSSRTGTHTHTRTGARTCTQGVFLAGAEPGTFCEQ